MLTLAFFQQDPAGEVQGVCLGLAHDVHVGAGADGRGVDLEDEEPRRQPQARRVPVRRLRQAEPLQHPAQVRQD